MTRYVRIAAVATVLVTVGALLHSSVSTSYEPCPVSPPIDDLGIALGAGYTALPKSDIEINVDAVRDSGSSWVRFDVDWSSIEAEQGQFDWSGTDRLVEASKSAGLEVLALITYTPAWARDSKAPASDSHTKPADPATFATFAAIAAQRYGDAISAWEIWNEPNLHMFFNPAPDPTYYSTLLSLSSAAIKRVQPHATIVSGGLSPAPDDGVNISPTTFLSEMYQSGVRTHFDAVGMHPYSFPAMPSDPLTKSWNAFFRMKTMRQTMIDNGDAAKTIWATEFGSPTGNDPTSVTTADQAAILRDGINEARRGGYVSKLFVYSLVDRGIDKGDREQNFGLLDAAFEPKPAMKVLEDASKTGGCT